MNLGANRRTALLVTASAVLISGLWIRDATQPTKLPQLPRSPTTMNTWLMRPIPPPPPPIPLRRRI